MSNADDTIEDSEPGSAPRRKLADEITGPVGIHLDFHAEKIDRLERVTSKLDRGLDRVVTGMSKLDGSIGALKWVVSVASAVVTVAVAVLAIVLKR